MGYAKENTDREGSKKLYEGKFFYELVNSKTIPGAVTLVGPYDNIYYLSSKTDSKSSLLEYRFVQVIDGIPYQAFSAGEILVSDTNLSVFGQRK